MPDAESENNVVKVDDLWFETLMPVRTIQVPQYEEQVPVELGVRITNHSSRPYRFKDTHLNWRTHQGLCLSGYANYGAVWQFCSLQLGYYQIRLEYKGLPQSVELLMQGEGRKKLVENFWTGRVSTAFAEFNLM